MVCGLILHSYYLTLINYSLSTVTSIPQGQAQK